MTAADLYCRQCNRRFNAAGELSRCPDCGNVLRSWRDVPTLVFADTQPGSREADDVAVNELLESRLGNYWIESFLGEGGMARVYRARHLTLERACAIKVLRPSVAARDSAAVASFLDEARAAASLVHPHVVTLHTIGLERDYHFIEMEYVDGLSLARLLDTERAVEVTEATRWMVEVSSALGLAHRMGMVHRDIKPANVMVSLDRRTKLADFGLAKRLIARVEGKGEQCLVGTPHYMAPELFRGCPADQRSDVYAMGVTYYCLLTGRLPINVNAISELVHIHRKPALIDFDSIGSTAGDAARTLLERCLAHDPRDRHKDAVELHAEFRAVYGSLRSLESLVREAIAGADIEIEGEGDQLVATVALGNGRSQRVLLELDCGKRPTEQVVTVYSVCAPIDERHFRRALELNAHIPHGAIAVENVHGEPHFIMSNSHPRATCDPEEVRQSILTIARYADQWEERLTGRDVH